MINSNLELIVYPGVLLQIDLPKILEQVTHEDEVTEKLLPDFTLNLPTKAEVRNASSYKWKSLEKDGVKFVQLPEAVTDYYVVMFHSKLEVFVIFTAFEIITADAKRTGASLGEPLSKAFPLLLMEDVYRFLKVQEYKKGLFLLKIWEKWLLSFRFERIAQRFGLFFNTASCI